MVVDATMAPAWWRLEFPPPCKRLSLNDRMGWREAQPYKIAWRHAGYYAGYEARREMPNPTACYVRVTFPVRDHRRRDADNPAPTVKAIVDGLVLARLWPDDTPDWVETLGSRFSTESRNVSVELIRR